MWLWLGPIIGVAVVFTIYALGGWLLFLLGLLTALFDLIYSFLRYGEFRESELTRRLLSL